MKTNFPFRYILYKISLLLFLVQVVSVIPLMYGSSELTINDFKYLAKWYVIPQILRNIIFAEHNFISTITCIPIVIGLIISFKEVMKRLKYTSLKILTVLLLIFEILVSIFNWVIAYIIAPPNF